MSIKRCLSIILVVLYVVIVTSFCAVAQTDMPGSKDHPMFSRMPGYYISDYQQEEFAAYDFRDENGNDVTVEGQLTEIVYTLPDSSPRAAKLKVLRNFSSAVTKIGGKFCDYAGNSTYMNIIREGQELWARVYATEDDYTLTIVQKGEVKQEVTADWMMEELNRSGRVALYINFATGKATIQAESLVIIDQITAVLKENAELTIEIQGHTDDVGSDEANMTLSGQRAQAVMQAIISRGVAAERLTATGFGEKNPLADNKTEEGRATNRRVELVKM